MIPGADAKVVLILAGKFAVPGLDATKKSW